MKPLALYRAVAADRVPQPGELIRSRGTVRLPTNIPYLADNLLEWLRPDDMPSRRQAIYASRTPALALAAAAADHRGLGYVVCELVFHGAYKQAQLSIEDAKHHPDIVRFVRLVQEKSALFLSDAARQETAAFFLPGSTPAQINACIRGSTIAADFAAHVGVVSTFWLDTAADHLHERGELFFELSEGSSYELRPIQTT